MIQLNKYRTRRASAFMPPALHNTLPYSINRIFLCCVLLFLTTSLAACDGDPTPYPVDMPVTPTDPPLPTEPPPVRVALASNTVDMIADTDFDLIVSSGTVEQLIEGVNNTDLGVRYDIVAQYGEIADWTLSPIMPRIMLVINPATLTPEQVDLVRRAIDPQAILAALNIPGAVIIEASMASPPETIRAELANIGQPDGLQLVMGHTPIPGATNIIEQLGAANIETQALPLSNMEIQTALTGGRLQLALVTWTTPEQQQHWHDLFGIENTLALYTLPISYRTLPELTLSYTPGGWPIASR